MILHNQRYYLMALNERWHNISYYQVDRITNMTIIDAPLTDIHNVAGFEWGINYKELSSALPYMYTDQPIPIEMIADEQIVDQIIDRFGNEIRIIPIENGKVRVQLKVSSLAMEHWATQYVNHAKIVKPEELRNKIKESLIKALQQYQ